MLCKADSTICDSKMSTRKWAETNSEQIIVKVCGREGTDVLFNLFRGEGSARFLSGTSSEQKTSPRDIVRPNDLPAKKQEVAVVLEDLNTLRMASVYPHLTKIDASFAFYNHCSLLTKLVLLANAFRLMVVISLKGYARPGSTALFRQKYSATLKVSIRSSSSPTIVHPKRSRTLFRLSAKQKQNHAQHESRMSSKKPSSSQAKPWRRLTSYGKKK